MFLNAHNLNIKKRNAFIGDWIATNVEEIEDHEILQMFAQEDDSVMNLASYTFEVCF